MSTEVLERVVAQSKSGEDQLKSETHALNEKILEREREIQRSKGLFDVFRENRVLEDMKVGRLAQPPIFYGAWGRVVGKLEQIVKGADECALPCIYDSFVASLNARNESHLQELARRLA
jgi:G3E family GTPase